ncbi:MAG: hypothetical protein J7527_17570 [Chitinophagaceae bacterium]|nr:hypothetical protein [Chitinophagaceae bacterium]
MRTALTFIRIFFYLIVLNLALQSCTGEKQPVSRTEMVKYIRAKKNGLTVEQEVNGVTVQLSYQPTSLLIAREMNPGDAIDSSKVKELTAKYSGRDYFLLKFSKDGKEAIRQLGSFSNYSGMVQVLSFQMNRFVNLTTPQKDTVELGDYFFDQTFGMNDGNTLLLSFDREKTRSSRSVEVNIGECGFGTGAIKFVLKRKDMEQVPELDYSKL